MASTDPTLWTTRRVFGVAGGPVEIALTEEGNARAFSVGAQVRRGPAAEALEALALAGGEGALVVRDGARLRATSLGKIDGLAWGHLRALGYVESVAPVHGVSEEGVRLTAAGRIAVENGRAERARLLARCVTAARVA